MTNRTRNRILLVGLFIIGLQSVRSQEIRVEEVLLRNDSITLPGTLSFPETLSRPPLVIFVHGSGNINRHGNQPGTMVQAGYIDLLRKALNARGIAFYAYDKRVAVPENTPYLDGVQLTDYVEDLKTVIRHLARDERFSGIHLIGHSQGVLVGALGGHTELRSFTGISGPALPVDSVLLRQLEAQSPQLAAEARPLLAKLKAGDSLDLTGAMPMVSLILTRQNRPLLREWMQYDPTAVFRAMQAPALLVYGGMDTQVPPEAGWSLYQSRPSSRLVVLPTMNHVLKQALNPSENQRAYTDPDIPLANGLAEILVEFIQSNL